MAASEKRADDVSFAPVDVPDVVSLAAPVDVPDVVSLAAPVDVLAVAARALREAADEGTKPVRKRGQRTTRGKRSSTVDSAEEVPAKPVRRQLQAQRRKKALEAEEAACSQTAAEEEAALAAIASAQLTSESDVSVHIPAGSKRSRSSRRKEAEDENIDKGVGDEGTLQKEDVVAERVSNAHPDSNSLSTSSAPHSPPQENDGDVDAPEPQRTPKRRRSSPMKKEAYVQPLAPSAAVNSAPRQAQSAAKAPPAPAAPVQRAASKRVAPATTSFSLFGMRAPALKLKKK
jgi:hypothetical protein